MKYAITLKEKNNNKRLFLQFTENYKEAQEVTVISWCKYNILDIAWVRGGAEDKGNNLKLYEHIWI